MHKGENEPFTCDPGGMAFWADGLPMPEPRSRRGEEVAGEKCVVLRSLDTSLSAKIRDLSRKVIMIGPLF